VVLVVLATLVVLVVLVVQVVLLVVPEVLEVLLALLVVLAVLMLLLLLLLLVGVALGSLCTCAFSCCFLRAHPSALHLAVVVETKLQAADIGTTLLEHGI
jgi:hypothetical protein